MTRSFTIATTQRAFARRWWLIRVHDTLDQLRAAAARYHPGADFSECWACCQTAAYRTNGRIVQYGGARGYTGVLRFAATHLTTEVVTHELLHAAVGTLRALGFPDVRLGRHVTDREEQLAYVYGELYADFERHFDRSAGTR
jgi:hypothetical protein